MWDKIVYGGVVPMKSSKSLVQLLRILIAKMAWQAECCTAEVTKVLIVLEVDYRKMKQDGERG